MSPKDDRNISRRRRMMVRANRNVTEKWPEQVGTSSVDGRADQNLVEGWSEQRMVRNRLGCHRRMIERSPEDNQGRSECRQKKTKKLSKDTWWSIEDGQEVIGTSPEGN
ncbi:unnamed protein product [Ilex paraguariensis]|uniref:Uncharacterized protein n=1 Tax=Ilex paraguariensis TaxID=185542 RepID=A0ABC8RPH7_9AQUA